MDILLAIALIAGIAAISVFNYYLNLAPGSDPEDFNIGPHEIPMRCDCAFNTLILGTLAVLFIAISSTAFDSGTEILLAGIVSFLTITVSGVIGRRKRHREWRQMTEVLHRAVLPGTADGSNDDGWIEIPFESDDDNDYYEEDEY